MEHQPLPRRSIRLLAISPRFAPINGADTHRLRLLLRYAAQSDWQVTVLAVDSADVVGSVDSWLADQVPGDVPVYRVRAWKTAGWGFNGLAQRSLWPLYRKGCELLAKDSFDLVFFSTTEFALHILGPMWKRRFGIPFCMDYQDPWVNDYYRDHPEVVPPGGRFKFAIAEGISRQLERVVVRSCSGFLAVSQAYLTEIARRYGASVQGKPMLVQPFPAEPGELDALGGFTAKAEGAASSMVWRYIGRGGPDMVKAGTAFFEAWRCALADGTIREDSVRFEAYGTSYADAGKGEKTFEPLAEAAGMQQMVTEVPDRLGYSDVLRMLAGSDALIVFGSDDPAYTASKIYPYLLAGKPLLAIFHEQSSVVSLIKQVGGGVCVTLKENMSIEELASTIRRAWFGNCSFEQSTALDLAAFEEFTARAQAKEIGLWFERILDCHRESAGQ